MDRKRYQIQPYHLLSKSGKWNRLKNANQLSTEGSCPYSCDEHSHPSHSERSSPENPTNVVPSSPLNPCFSLSVTDQVFHDADPSNMLDETPIVDEIADFSAPFLYSSDDSQDALDCNSSRDSLFDVKTTSGEFEYNNIIKPSAAIATFLRQWALDENISHSSLSNLCKGLKVTHPQCLSDLPTDARTILRTPRDALNIKAVPPGEYFHVGLKKQINLALSLLLLPISHMYILFNVDGMPLFKSGKGELWPILMEIPSSTQLKNKVFPVGIYFGDGKPHDLNLFFSQFLEELLDVLQNPFNYNNRTINVKLLGFCCDAPAKAFVLGVITHTGFFSCTRCTVEGETFENRRIFRQLNCPPRTDVDFRNRTDTHYQPADRTTPLIVLPQLDFVKSFALDYMHLVCLGVVRTLLSLWTFGPRPFLLPIQMRMAISNFLVNFKNYIPSEFARRPRELKLLPRWKATELRSFLLYLAPVVLKLSFLHTDKYLHFLSLHVAMTILLNPSICKDHSMRQYARKLLIHFVQLIPDMYSSRLLTHNFHNLINLVDDADHFSYFISNFSLNGVSSFPFENFLQIFKKLVRGKAKPLQQIARRITELFSLGHIKNMYQHSSSHSFPYFKNPHLNGPLPAFCYEPQYKTIVFPSFKISVDSADNCCCVENGGVVLVENIAFSEKLSTYVIIGRKYIDKCDFFSEPLCPSSNLNIYKVKNLSDRDIWSVKDIKFKFVRLPFEDEFVVIPLLHTNDYFLKWTVVRKIDGDDEEYDSIPNNWITSPSSAFYPDKGSATVTKLAKNCTSPARDWMTISIQIIKENYESFERSMTDVIRFGKGARSISASETEERGAGRRMVRQRRMSNSSEEGEYRGYPKPPKILRRSPRKQKVKKNLDRAQTSSSSPAPPPQSPEISCDIPQKLHFCASNKPVTLESLAIGLCHLSKAVNNLNRKIKDFRMEAMSKITNNETSTLVEDETEDNSEIDLKNLLPLKNMQELQEFEVKLEDKDFCSKIIKFLLRNVEKTNVSKTARSTLRQLMDISLCQRFSWKGQQRKDQEEKKECFSTLNMVVLIYKCVKSVWPNEFDIKKRIETTLATWLAQQGSMYLKRSSATFDLDTINKNDSL